MTPRGLELPRLLVLTDRSQLPLGRSLHATLAAAVDAGLTHVLLRELDLDDGRRGALAADLATLGLTVIAARRPLPGCAAVHLAAGQPAPSGADPSTAPPLPHGRSCHTRAEVEGAVGGGASYVTLGPFAPTPSKPGHGPPPPRTAYGDHAVPVLALGGITPANAAAARESGAYGVAVMGAVMRAGDPGATVARLLEEVA